MATIFKESAKKEPKKTPTIYIDYLDHKNGYKPARKYFITYESAWKWMTKTFDTPNKDFINYC